MQTILSGLNTGRLSVSSNSLQVHKLEASLKVEPYIVHLTFNILCYVEYITENNMLMLTWIDRSISPASSPATVLNKE